MRTVAIMMLLGVFIFGGSIGIPESRASDSQPQCVQDAKTTFIECKAICQEDFQVAKDGCRNVPHECAESCRSVRETCVDEALNELDACLGPCNSAFLQARADCRLLYAPGSKYLDHCIDATQITAFICRDDCRESVQLAAAMKICGKAFRLCIKGCMNPSPK
jgi:hypothetical protein